MKILLIGFRNVQNNFRLKSSAAMSAPGSGVSSPVLSSQRVNSGDSFPSPFVATQGFIWSAPEMTPADMFMDPFLQASSDRIWYCHEHSPCHGCGMNTRSPIGAVSPLHPRSSPKSSSTWQEYNGHAIVHPLPLPPGPTVSSQTLLGHQTIIKPCQWKKGKLIGHGTFGSVFVATNRETGALCAIKEVDLIPDNPKSAECMKQLE